MGAEPDELIALAESHDVRLITLAGVGGIGKTVLATELGRSRLRDFADGVFFVPLAVSPRFGDARARRLQPLDRYL